MEALAAEASLDSSERYALLTSGDARDMRWWRGELHKPQDGVVCIIFQIIYQACKRVRVEAGT